MFGYDWPRVHALLTALPVALLALVTLGIFAVLAIWRLARERRMGTGERTLALVVGLAGLAFLVNTGHHGGELVFEHAAGVPNATLQAELANRLHGHQHGGGAVDGHPEGGHLEDGHSEDSHSEDSHSEGRHPEGSHPEKHDDHHADQLAHDHADSAHNHDNATRSHDRATQTNDNATQSHDRATTDVPSHSPDDAAHQD
ncbi:MAG TPA: DUF2231 domain-containing protein [Gemmatimonadales bacterium]|nr:DUF2231 domain-containing protein [Gemmatimonadales bacterium]